MRGIFLIFLFTITTAWAKEEPTLLVYNTTTNQTVVSQNADVSRPVASITKLVTAMVALDQYKLTDRVKTGKHTSVTVENLLIRLLVRSDNGASEILAKYHPGGREEFLSLMNTKVKAMGAFQTKFNDPSGLLHTNTSTAQDLVKIVNRSATYEFIQQVTSKAEIKTNAKIKNKLKTITMPNTNHKLLNEYHNILVSKTGYTSRAGRCLAILVENNGEKYAIIILGERTTFERERTARDAINNYTKSQNTY